MALFSDGPPAALDDLVQQDSFLLTVASTEGIDVTTKIELAYNAIGIELEAIFDREASLYAPVLGQAPLDTAHLAVTAALKQWHTFRSLELVYRDAYFNQLNDRYKAKWGEFQSLACLNRSWFIETGAGLVIDPLDQPGAPTTSFQAASQAGGTVYFTVTFVNAESEQSTPATQTQSVVPDGNVLVIGAPSPPANATGWNIFGGTSPEAMVLQNSALMGLDETWQFVLPGVQSGPAPGTGQSPNVTRDLPRRIMRG
jgi:hypothetical protein